MGPKGALSMSKDETQERKGRGLEGIQFHSVGYRTQRHTRRRVLELLVKTQPLVPSLAPLWVCSNSCSCWADWSLRPEWLTGRMFRGGRGTRSGSQICCFLCAQRAIWAGSRCLLLTGPNVFCCNVLTGKPGFNFNRTQGTRPIA